MVKSKNPSGRVNPPAPGHAPIAGMAAPTPRGPNMPIFFYMPHEQPYGVFCQWQKSYFKVPKSTFSYLDRNAAPGQIPKPGEVPKKKQEEETLTFNCAEQYMMYCKAIFFNDHKAAAKILFSKDPRDQKALGRQVQGYKEHDWALIRVRVGEEGNYAKFMQDEKLKSILLGTGDRLLCEAARRDAIWGIGMDERTAIATWNAMGDGAEMSWGLNLLGKSLIATRARIRKEEGCQTEAEKAKEELEKTKEEYEKAKEEPQLATEKRMKVLNRKLKEIEVLKQRRDAGDKLESLQLKKIGTEGDVKKELKELENPGVIMG
jgi:ribA/ribD-fused uncharacterized protein